MSKDLDLILRKAVQIFSKEGLIERLNSGKKLKIKLGADPSRPDLHLGHSVVLRALRIFQKMGHEVIFIVGDYTAMIGDPSGKSKTRPALTFEETRKAGETYFEQATKILDKDKTRIEYNSKWLSKLTFEEVLKLTSKYTVSQILQRDDFKNRYEGNQPIGMHELIYPLMQGYDSVALGADVEIGGTDQTFNLLVGRELQKDYDQKQQEVITFPLLVGLDGVEKMSKSLDNYIGLDESPEKMFEKAMKIPDVLMEDYFRLTTDIPTERYQEWINDDIRTAHAEYGKEIIRMYHSEEVIEQSVKRYSEVAKGAIPENILEVIVPSEHVQDGAIRIIDALKLAGFANSNGEARRMIIGNGVKLDNNIVTDTNLNIDFQSERVLQFGKSKFVKLIKEC
ncbi:MAG: tyrosine--tRNA ligase [Candidatus Delongbacteria bacterium]|jgi:tyrosyl-tRNA synthetase|nr:tyrosine--tRNA ligase [Candidatus Delongbacteria bacterium]